MHHVGYKQWVTVNAISLCMCIWACMFSSLFFLFWVVVCREGGGVRGGWETEMRMQYGNNKDSWLHLVVATTTPMNNTDKFLVLTVLLQDARHANLFIVSTGSFFNKHV